MAGGRWRVTGGRRQRTAGGGKWAVGTKQRQARDELLRIRFDGLQGAPLLAFEEFTPHAMGG